MLGELTESWREDHRAEIDAAAKERDALLSIEGVKPRQISTDSAAKPAEPIAPSRPARQWLIGELSEFQRRLMDCFLTYTAKTGKPLLTEDPDAFSVFCEDDRLVESLADFEQVSPNRIGRTLSQLAELGLIAKVTLVKPSAFTGQEDYLKAFRPLRDSELRRLADLERLRGDPPMDAAAEAGGQFESES
jgi:type I restriction enzyme S subunit